MVCCLHSIYEISYIVTVRNRSRELVELLSDVEKIRGERRKAKTNKSKYVGVGNDGMTGMSFSGTGGRYGGFGSDSLGGGSGSSYGNGEFTFLAFPTIDSKSQKQTMEGEVHTVLVVAAMGVDSAITTVDVDTRNTMLETTRFRTPLHLHLFVPRPQFVIPQGKLVPLPHLQLHQWKTC